MRSHLVGLDWLPDPPADFRDRLVALRAEANPLAAWRAAVALARTHLSATATNALDRASAAVGPRTVRLALLGSSTTHHLAGALRVGGLRRELGFELYEPAYGQFRQELDQQASGFHAFSPTHVLFAFDADSVAGHVRGAATRAEAVAHAEALIENWRRLWTAARCGGNAAIMQAAVMPRLPAVGGSNDHRLPDSGAAFVADINARLRAAADAEGIDVIAVDARAARDGIDAWFSPPSWHAAKQEVALPAAPLYGDLVARVIASRLGRSAKCCVFDLDNTLWGGVVGDDGLEGIVLGQGSAAGEAFLNLQNYALALKRRGILLAVCSKNDEAVALAAFERHPDMILKRGDFACFVANWQDKASNLRAIAKALNIGTDALVFVDDNPYEREQVRGALPEVFVPELPADPALVARCIADAGCFELVTLTSEDQGRTELYAADAERKTALEGAGDLGSFLLSLNMVLEHAPVTGGDIARVTQLLNKTNQFNLATRRLSEDEVRATAADPDGLALLLRLTDRFGDNGIIAVVSGHRADAEAFRIDDWLMSCRVLGRDVEYATLLALVSRLKARGMRTLEARYAPSGRNGMVSDLLFRLGFETTDDAAGGHTGRLDLDGFVPRPSPVALREVGR